MLVVNGTTPLIILCVVIIRTQADRLDLIEVLHQGRGWEVDVAQGAKQVIMRYLVGCQLVLAAPSNSRALLPFIRSLFEVGELAVFMQPCDDSKLRHGNAKDNDFLKNDRVSSFWRDVWQSSKATCRGFLLDHSACGISTATRLLSWSGLWLQPTTRVIMFGDGKDAHMLFQHSALRNTLHVLYITYDSFTSHYGSRRHTMNVYHQCLYCYGQGTGLLHRWNLDGSMHEDMFTDQVNDFMGHKMNVVSMAYFPYVSFNVVQKASATTLYLENSLGVRMITTLARYMNFTFEVREPVDKQWGVHAGSGNWTGIVGTLQHEMADFSMDLTVTPGRAEVIEFSRAHVDQSIVILSSKPKPLPEYLSVIRPLEGEVWGAIVMGIMVWGSVLWMLERLSHWITGRRYFSFPSSVFYSWGLLLEDHPFDPPPSPSSQILVGWWLLVYLILSTAYKSSLISHLAVQGKSSVINNMEELVERGEEEGWVWGVPRGPMTGSLRSFFASNPNPAILRVYKKIKITETEEGMQRVLDGGFSYIDNYYFMKAVVSTFYTYTTGYTPVHFSTSRYPLFGGNGWGFRRGAPFRSSIDSNIQRIIDAGLITYWMDDVILTQVRKDRQASQQKSLGPQLTLSKVLDGQVVLGLNHLQGTLFALLLGHTLASFSFICELLLRLR